MKHQRFAKKFRPTKKQLWIGVPALLSAVGVYILITVLAPAIPPATQSEATFQKPTTATPVQARENRLYIPAIGVDVAIVTGKTAATLEKGAWHRKPQNGDPEKGSNFVLSAHRFKMGFTPWDTRAKSPFYHIDKLQTGDKIFVDYNQNRYTYEITRKYKVDRYAVSIEAPSSEAKLTLYSCNLGGEASGREVIEAKKLEPDTIES